ncbi:response regulator [Phenylobacterium terrae]|uniref:Response regulator n=1 Tax=Phenylobacterium terrae TaxID=2665495 RepID=A0ABW4MWQ5_9CAUL
MSKSKPPAGARADAPPSARAPSREGLQPKVLVVHDHPLHRILADTVFAQFGCEVTLVESGEAALAACTTEAFVLIVLDRRMPGLGGDDVVQRLRAQDGPSRAAFVASCSTDPPGELSAGYDTITPKPLTPSAAARLLEDALRRSPMSSHLAPIVLARGGRGSER